MSNSFQELSDVDGSDKVDEDMTLDQSSYFFFHEMLEV